MRRIVMGLVLAGVAWGQEEKAVGPEPAAAVVEEKEEMIVTAERGEEEKRLSGDSVTIIDAKRFEIRQDDEVQEAIRFSPGVHVAQTGGKGGFTSLFIRGGESDHALFLVDGMEVNSDGGSIDLALLTTDGVGRFEIVRGAGSSVWGADAMSGVVNVRTKRGWGPPRARFSVEAGNFSTYRERLGFETGNSEYGVTLALSRYDRWNGRFDHSDYRNSTAVGRFDWAVGEATSVTATIRYVDEEAEQYTDDPGPFFIEEDHNGEKEEDDLVLGLEVTHLLTDWWSVTARVGRFDEDVEFDDLGAFDFDSTSDFERTKAGFQTDAEVIRNDDLLMLLGAGVEWEREELQQTNTFTTGLGTNEKRNNRAMWVRGRFEAWDRLAVVLTGRVDDNRAFGTARTGKAAVSYDILEIGTRPHASIGNGIKTPTMTESFSSNPFFLGNKDLDPEKSRTIDIGVEQRLFDGLVIADLTFFENRMFDLIAFTGLSPAFINGGHARARGWEFQIEVHPLDWLKIAGGWTYQRTRVTHSETTSLTFQEGERLIRRPDNAGFAEVAVQWFYEDGVPKAEREEHPRFSASLHAHYVGNRDDVIFYAFPDAPVLVRNNDYLKVDLAAEWWIVDRTVRAFGVVENLADVDYQEVIGYPNDPINFMLGLEFAFDVPKLKRNPPK